MVTVDDISVLKYPEIQDPACGSYSNAILFYKGYQAIQVHRIAHCLWNKGQKISARALQSRVSEVSTFELSSRCREPPSVTLFAKWCLPKLLTCNNCDRASLVGMLHVKI